MSDQSENLLTRARITPVSLPPFESRLNQATAISPVGIVPSIETPSDAAVSLNNSVGGDWVQPANDKINDTKVVYHGGCIASGVAIVLIYWGDAWTYPVNTPLLYEFDGAARNLVSGPFPSALKQYGVERPWVKESILITKPWPPTTFEESDINKIVFALIENGRYPEPDEDGEHSSTTILNGIMCNEGCTESVLIVKKEFIALDQRGCARSHLWLKTAKWSFGL